MRLKFHLMLALLTHYLLVAGQVEMYQNTTSSMHPDYQLQVVLDKMTMERPVENEKRWCYADCKAQRVLGIRHQPAKDFNIYLTLVQEITPTIQAAMEVSLNYSGVVNLRSLIALQKKRR